ncbi:branched-chain amino acid ABC transporter permease [Pseudoduganella ginsengisoli]|uniref:Branched-chain amino acid ABC transporter permease n=1 Tax=Pseudoduganella ginsengisoli TaxID=1462440 RepID=A0A6L6PV70_9BURK|nr:branched-chain amino acid ABC transporter permease [Pseudoduganella ginsengisoli]MTW01443.1 branched-chain amino acid ABC transporter permease [Pseudoduganella ginsengisoli]
MNRLHALRAHKGTAAALLLLAAVVLAWGGNPYVMSITIAALVTGGVALAWALLGNLGGMVSFGHAAFAGAGAYVSALCTLRLGVPVPAGIVLGALGAAISALAMLPALRLRGPYFALAILAYAHIFKIIATEWTSVTRGAAGLSGIPPLPVLPGLDAKASACLLAGLLVLAFALVYQFIRASHAGLALRAMHASEDATRVLGVNSTLLKGMMLLVSAAMAGAAGAFNVHYIGFLEPDYAFGATWVTLPIVAAIFGGYRTLAGPVIGALAVSLADQLLFKEWLPTGHQFLLGVLLVAMILASPGGLLPLADKMLRRLRPSSQGDTHA